MPVLTRQCSLDRRPWPRRALTIATQPLTRYLSQQAAHPHGLGGPLIGRLWVKETAKTNDAAIDLLAPGAGEDILEIGRQKRNQMYDLFADGQTPTFLAPRRLRIGIRERVLHPGQARVPDDGGPGEGQSLLQGWHP